MNNTEINIAICKALGIDPSAVNEVTIQIQVGRKPTVTVRHFLTDGQVTQLNELVGDKFKLVPAGEVAS